MDNMKDYCKCFGDIQLCNLLLILIMACSNAACYYNSAERNKITFQDNSTHIQNALQKMERLILKLPKSEFNINYSIVNDSITINNGPRGIDSSDFYTKEGFKVFTSAEKKQFISLANYLKKNFITAGYLHYNTRVCLFIYKKQPKDTYNDLREITFLKYIDDNVVSNEHKVLDRKDELILLAPIDAKIYDNFILRK